jgi:hypothetical protein
MAGEFVFSVAAYNPIRERYQARIAFPQKTVTMG